ncbi:Crp/Fnr family transcriptional regulator [Anaeropeptidivorans aminofermentans]|uniref:Crp/Fnr family transcriptional regulator n=1 Tax=Anaeropeptidivorans aminofermentans TaxID=2934315 RepID=UPI002024ED2D|nr:Crp/Fnr family transcriptional regulator [Anaeropeptidivorans aminofermentans]MBE6012471.1 Crp/Fnr family transcriptional regulator [Lachnospiraceae bacterium]
MKEEKHMLPFWDKLRNEQKLSLESSLSAKKFSKGQILHQGGNDCSGLFIVKSGRLRAFIISQSGREITLYRLFERDICLFSASCIMKNISFDINIEAETDTEVFVIPADTYEELMKTSVEVSDYTNQLMASRFSDVMWIMEQALFTSLDSRLSHFLLEERNIEGSDSLKITHEEIAMHLGSAREAITRMLKYFQEENLVQLSRGKITLMDIKGLRNLISY